MGFFRRIFGKSSEEEAPVQSSVVEEKVEEKATEETTPTDSDGETSSENAATPAATAFTTRQLGPTPGVTQPLSQETSLTSQVESIAFGQSSDVGQVRTNNQDSAFSYFFSSDSLDEHPNLGVFIVADGMGGHHDGEKASAITIRTIGSVITQNIYLPMLGNAEGEDRPPITDAMVSAVHKANAKVLENVPDGGTTVTAVCVVGDLAHIAHVGDSRAYLLTKDSIEQITRDHSLVQRLIELDQLTLEEAATHPQKNVLYRAIGQNDALEVDILTRRLPQHSRLLICSDGLWGQVDEKELYEIAMNVPNPQIACDKLVATANMRGGLDNITAILLKVS